MRSLDRPASACSVMFEKVRAQSTVDKKKIKSQNEVCFDFIVRVLRYVYPDQLSAIPAFNAHNPKYNENRKGVIKG